MRQSQSGRKTEPRLFLASTITVFPAFGHVRRTVFTYYVFPADLLLIVFRSNVPCLGTQSLGRSTVQTKRAVRQAVCRSRESRSNGRSRSFSYRHRIKMRDPKTFQIDFYKHFLLLIHNYQLLFALLGRSPWCIGSCGCNWRTWGKLLALVKIFPA